ncbi:transport and Golgi organization protein 6 [Contarinia nasturtii]|uniref:transport and Golgi organization protein 6 n=1 Tax=Contarinia nasturtii TaxID=265458 RepID=UPI0012D387EA|nr:transport and Golgi organization protein 6 [Contarinia nasturtii]
MSNTNRLKSLIKLIADEENYSCNVSIRAKLDEKAANELSSFQNSRSTEESTLYQKILYDEIKCPQPNSSESPVWVYATSVFEILLEICAELDKSDELPISVTETKKVHIGIRKAIEYGLKPFLLGVATPIDYRLPYIIASTKILLNISKDKFFPLICTRSDQHLIYTDLLSSIFTIICNGSDEIKTQFEQHLLDLRSRLSHGDYFKILFLIQGSNQNRAEASIQQITCKQLMQSLRQAGSFKALCEALLPSITSLDQDEEIVKKRLHCCAVISSIVGKRGHKKEFYHQIIDEITQHLLSFIQSNKSHQIYFVDVGVQCLSKLYSLQLGFIRRHITDILLRTFDNLALPCDMITGAVVCESNEFIDAIHLVHLTFCATGPSDDTLASEILTPFMPMFIQIHHLLNESTNMTLKNEILAIIVRCLSNREKGDLNRIVEWILYEEYDEGVKCLHPRLKMKQINDDNISFTVVALETDQNDLDINSFLEPSVSLVNVLKQCNHNTLIYNVFLHLLQMFSDSFGSASKIVQSPSSSELLGGESELKTAIERKFKRKYSVIHALNELILFKPFHGQFAENQQDIVEMLNKMLNQQIEQIETFQRINKKIATEDFDEILIVILSIVGDFMQRIQNDELKAQLEWTLKKLRTLLVGQDMNTVMKKLDTMLGSSQNHDENSLFLEAKAILSETHSEPYTKVYAIMNMVKLVNAKDEETCLNAHVILALALKLLREEDSYIFLNCIKLLITLVEILEDTVIVALIAEYHFDIDNDLADIDFKLKIGETIVKTCQGLGEMCYKYKAVLINCFLRGAYNRNVEFRTSNMSNLGVIMRILSYQVHHFFEEVMILIQNTLQLDKYLPTRRAAALVLTDLLKGMQNLEQYQEFLLPIYRNLKSISKNDPDLHMQIHARNGLECLREKIKEAFTTETKMEKEIRIFDIKTDENVRYK